VGLDTHKVPLSSFRFALPPLLGLSWRDGPAGPVVWKPGGQSCRRPDSTPPVGSPPPRTSASQRRSRPPLTSRSPTATRTRLLPGPYRTWG
jgi:hypothetical protein